MRTSFSDIFSINLNILVLYMSSNALNSFESIVVHSKRVERVCNEISFVNRVPSICYQDYSHLGCRAGAVVMERCQGVGGT